MKLSILKFFPKLRRLLFLKTQKLQKLDLIAFLSNILFHNLTIFTFLAFGTLSTEKFCISPWTSPSIFSSPSLSNWNPSTYYTRYICINNIEVLEIESRRDVCCHPPRQRPPGAERVKNIGGAHIFQKCPLYLVLGDFKTQLYLVLW